MKPEIPPTIVDPCPLAWNGMQGDDKRRFCEHCQLHVHNLSQMNARERQRLLGSEAHLCVTYAVDEKGALVEQARRFWISRFFARFRTAALALVAAILPLGTACANRQVMGKPAPPIPSPTPDPSAPRGRIIMGEVAPPTPSPTPKLIVPGGIAPPPPTPSPAPKR
jgi:hypothetical protein